MDAKFVNYTRAAKSKDEIGLASALARLGPLTVCYYAGLPSFQAYSSGIYSDPNCLNKERNHCSVLVGYGIIKILGLILTYV